MVHHVKGSETFDHIRELGPSVKIILCSGYSLASQAQQILDKGCQGVLQKPFSVSLVSKVIGEGLEKQPMVKITKGRAFQLNPFFFF